MLTFSKHSRRHIHRVWLQDRGRAEALDPQRVRSKVAFRKRGAVALTGAMLMLVASKSLNLSGDSASNNSRTW